MSDPTEATGANESEEGALARFVHSDGALLVGILVVGVVVPGLLRRWLGVWGYPLVGTVVFVLGYATMVFVVWWGWIRPLDLTGPEGDPHDAEGSPSDEE